MNTKFIQLEKRRSFDEIFNDTFSFFKSNFLQMAKGFIPMILPFFVLLSLSLYSTTQMMTDPSRMADFSSNSAFGGMGLKFAMPMFLSLFFYLFAFCFIFAYMKLYNRNKGVKVSIKEAYSLVFSRAFSIIGLGILSYLMTVLGTILCLLPGIYLMNVLSLALPILIIREESVFASISGAFSLIKKNWWKTFGVMFVITFITGILLFILDIPILFAVFSTDFLDMGIESFLYSSASGGLFVVQMYHMLVGNLLSMIVFIALGVMYFSYNEEKSGGNLLNELDQIGK